MPHQTHSVHYMDFIQRHPFQHWCIQADRAASLLSAQEPAPPTLPKGGHDDKPFGGAVVTGDKPLPRFARNQSIIQHLNAGHHAGLPCWVSPARGHLPLVESGLLNSPLQAQFQPLVKDICVQLVFKQNFQCCISENSWKQNFKPSHERICLINA